MDDPGSASISTSLAIREDSGAPMTDFTTIFNAVYNINHKSGASTDTPLDRPVPPTSVTAVDGVATNSTNTTVSKRGENTLQKKRQELIDDYYEVFAGTGTEPNDRDAAIEASAYLTYTVVSNYTYNAIDCLQFCDSIQEFGKSLAQTLGHQSFMYIQCSLTCTTSSTITSSTLCSLSTPISSAPFLRMLLPRLKRPISEGSTPTNHLRRSHISKIAADMRSHS